MSLGAPEPEPDPDPEVLEINMHRRRMAHKGTALQPRSESRWTRGSECKHCHYVSGLNIAEAELYRG